MFVPLDVVRTVICKENFENIRGLIVTIHECVTNVRKQFMNVHDALLRKLNNFHALALGSRTHTYVSFAPVIVK